ncbi:MAG: IS1595 family transposase, partial [Fusobacteriaceae bacterium]
RCLAKGCQHREHFFETKLSMDTYIHIVYLLICDINYRQLYLFYGISNSTISRIKKHLHMCFKTYLERRTIFLGGNNCKMEVDETVLSRKGIIREPTSTDDSRTDTVWILGLVDPNQPRNFFVKRIANRQASSLTIAIDGSISIGSVLTSDGYPSYPYVARSLGIEHRVVNYSRNFVADDGTHTNNIESFWAHLKKSCEMNVVLKGNLLMIG